MDWKLELIAVPVSGRRPREVVLPRAARLRAARQRQPERRVPDRADGTARSALRDRFRQGTRERRARLGRGLRRRRGHRSRPRRARRSRSARERALPLRGRRADAGPDTERSDYNTFFSLDDPDGNAWLVQEVGAAELVPRPVAVPARKRTACNCGCAAGRRRRFLAVDGRSAVVSLRVRARRRGASAAWWAGDVSGEDRFPCWGTRSDSAAKALNRTTFVLPYGNRRPSPAAGSNETGLGRSCAGARGRAAMRCRRAPLHNT